MRAHQFSILGLLFVSLSMVGLTATASTPDGKTPNVETVCDPLMADDVTQGLYGLCLAFCEAQDIASEDYPITDEELAILQGTPPSGSILDTYNTIKKETDPDMPCIVVDSTCPCWTEEELAAIEGFIPGRDDGFLDCNYQTDMNTGIVFLASAAEVIPPQQLSIFAVAVNSEQFQRCDYRNNQVTDPRRFRDVSPGQAAVCLQQVIDHCASLGQGQ